MNPKGKLLLSPLLEVLVEVRTVSLQGFSNVYLSGYFLHWQKGKSSSTGTLVGIILMQQFTS